MEKKFEEMTNATNNGHSTPITTTKIKHPQLKPVDPLLPNTIKSWYILGKISLN